MSELTAILLCGGKGRRLRPFTDTLPKSLVSINGKPLIYHLMRQLGGMGISHFIVCVGYKGEAIEKFVNENREPKWNVKCINSGDVSITDRITDAQNYFSGQGIICYGDTLANVNLTDLRKDHQKNGGLATITVYPYHSPFGIVAFDNSERVSEFIEKPQLPYWMNIGFLLCEQGAFEFIQPRSDFLEFLTAMAKAGVLYAHKHPGEHLTVNTEKDRALAENKMYEFFTCVEGYKI